MRLVTRNTLAAALGLALLAGTSQAKVSGFCEHDGQRLALVDGAAWLQPADEDEDWDEDDGPAPGPEFMLAFVTFAIDAGALARSEDREEGIRDQSWEQDEAARLELTVQDGQVHQQYLWISPGTNLSYSSNEVGHYRAGKGAAGRMAGSYRFSPEDGQDMTCEVDFDLALVGDVADAPPLPGTPLPADGGEPGRLYLALNAAMRAGDVDALAKLLPPSQAAEMEKARKSPDFAQQLAMMQALAAQDVRIVGGRQDGDRAWVEFTATEGGQPRAGTAEMKREAGHWTMLKESTRDPD